LRAAHLFDTNAETSYFEFTFIYNQPFLFKAGEFATESLVPVWEWLKML